MKVLILLSLVSGVMLEAPYPASGWRPDGPAFELPEREQTQRPQYQPVDPRNPKSFDGVDVSVQGLPTAEQQIFQLSPINGQQYSGPSVNADVAKLNPSLQQVQYQQQLQIAREFARQREYDAVARQAPTYQAPKQFGQTTIKPQRTPQEDTTEQLDLNEGEELEATSRNQPEKVSVEITKQNIQEYPAEFFLTPLSQLNQNQFVPVQQLGQLQNAPVVYQQVQSSQGFDGPAHLAALPSVLAQRELFQQQRAQFSQNPIIVQQEAIAEPAPQYQLNQYQPIQPQLQPAQTQYQPIQPQLQSVQSQYQPIQPQLQPVQPQYQPNQPQIQTVQYQPVQPQFQGQPQIQTTFPIQPQIQPNQYQPIQPGQYPIQPEGQYQPQIVFQPQNQPTNQFQPANPEDVEQIEPTNQQQPIVQTYQPQFFQQPNQQPLIALPITYEGQLGYYQNQAKRQNLENQQGLESGLDINQEGNDIDEKDKEDDRNTATAVATAFGTRTQPRVQYGVPSVQRQASSRYRTTTEATFEEPTTDSSAVAEATAASGRRNAKQRSRRIRPVFTLDKSGHLVLAQNTA